MIQRERVTVRSAGGKGGSPGGGSYVLYWMQRSQREGCNHALEYAVERAGELGLPVLVLFVLLPDYPEATERHYRFMLEGLSGTARRLKERGIGFIIRKGTPLEEVPRLAEKAALLVGDRSYLRTPRQWRAEVEERIDCPYHEVESDAVVPVETASEKEEYTAGTLRPKIHRRLFHFLVPLLRREVVVPWSGEEAAEQEDAQVPSGVEEIPQADRHIPRGGEDAAEELLEQFIADKLEGFDSYRNDPAQDYASGLSPYLHFGQISPLTIALA
ncbi:MAG: deoxyribodipyrimidine photo-lyase, partial [Spirochaetia bacterium]